MEEFSIASELRAWIQLTIVGVGGVIALLTYGKSQNQRRLENSLRLSALIKEELDFTLLGHWQEIFVAASESAGAQNGCFVGEQGRQVPFEELFDLTAADQGATRQIADRLNVICHQILDGAVAPEIIYFEWGQLIDSISRWLESIPDDFFTRAYPHLAKVHRKYGKRPWPRKVWVQLC